MAIVAVDPRLEIPTKYFLLRVTKRAWEDLGFRTRTVRFLRGAPDLDEHPLLAKFWTDCARVDAVDAGERIRGVEHPKVFRLKATGPGGSYRGAVWYDYDSAVLWLLRVVTLSRFPNEQAAYAQFRTFEVQRTLFPSHDERLIATQDQLLTSLLEALREAAVEALTEPGNWVSASTTTPIGTTYAGRVCMDTDDDGVLTRFFLTVGIDRATAQTLPPMWREALLTYVFPPDERGDSPVAAFQHLPRGTVLASGEYPLMFDCYTDVLRSWLDSPGRHDP